MNFYYKSGQRFTTIDSYFIILNFKVELLDIKAFYYILLYSNFCFFKILNNQLYSIKKLTILLFHLHSAFVLKLLFPTNKTQRNVHKDILEARTRIYKY